MPLCLRILVFAAALAATAAATPVRAQDAQSAPAANTVIGPRELRDFSIVPQRRIVEQPRPQPPQQTAPATPTQRPPAAGPARTERAAPPPRQVEEPGDEPPAASTPEPAPIEAPVEAAPEPFPVPAEPEPLAPPPAPAVSPSSLDIAVPLWAQIAGAGLLGLFLLVLLFRRRRPALAEGPSERATLHVPAQPPVPAAAPPPLLAQRPWIGLELKAERAVFSDSESSVDFELEIANSGEAPARNIRIDVKMFNAGAGQDKAIGAFYRTAGREQTRLNLPTVEPGISGIIRGSVSMKLEDMRAVKLDERLLFVPVIAVNALYEWPNGEGAPPLIGQTSRSYLIGREQSEPGEKMGAFRVDQGPRIWRTVGQRAHTLTRRV